MLKPIYQLIFVSLLNIHIFGQVEPTSAPIKWEYYKVSDKNIALLFPKMPVLITRSDQCREEKTSQYAVYANEAVYVLAVTNKISADVKNFCVNQRAFSENNLLDRIASIKNQLKTTNETKLKLNGADAIKVQSGDSTYWFINDLKNNRWYELWVIGTDESKSEVKSFIESIKIGKPERGIEIGDGASQTLGDNQTQTANNESKSTEASATGTGIRLVLRPAPPYTEVARRNLTAGVTRLRVTFLASGGIGAVTPITALPDGLTEQAIAAAKKIVFIPAKFNNKPVTVSKLVEYSFSIY